jgi:hypothetical protein
VRYSPAQTRTRPGSDASPGQSRSPCPRGSPAADADRAGGRSDDRPASAPARGTPHTSRCRRAPRTAPPPGARAPTAAAPPASDDRIRAIPAMLLKLTAGFLQPPASAGARISDPLGVEAEHRRRPVLRLLVHDLTRRPLARHRTPGLLVRCTRLGLLDRCLTTLPARLGILAQPLAGGSIAEQLLASLTRTPAAPPRCANARAAHHHAPPRTAHPRPRRSP